MGFLEEGVVSIFIRVLIEEIILREKKVVYFWVCGGLGWGFGERIFRRVVSNGEFFLWD